MRLSVACSVLCAAVAVSGCFPDSVDDLRVGLGIGMEAGRAPSEEEVRDYVDYRLAQMQQAQTASRFVLGDSGNFYLGLSYFCRDSLSGIEVVADSVTTKATGELDYIELEAIVDPCDEGRFSAVAYHLVYQADQTQSVEAFQGAMLGYTRIPPANPDEQLVLNVYLLGSGGAGCRFVAPVSGDYTFAVMDEGEFVVFPPKPVMTLKQGEERVLDFSGLPMHRNLVVVYSNDYGPGYPGTWHTASSSFVLDEGTAYLPDVCNM